MSNSKALSALAAAALAIPGLAVANTAPTQTTVGYHFNGHNEAAFNAADVSERSALKPSYKIINHQVHAATGLGNHVGLTLDYAFETLSGASVQAAYLDATQDGLSWQGTDKAQIILGGASIVEQRHEVVADSRLYFNNVVAGLEGYFSTENDYRSAGVAVDANFDGAGDRTVYTVGASYYNDKLNPTPSNGKVGEKPTAADPARLEAWNKVVHQVSVSQGLSAVVNKNLLIRFDASATYRLGHQSDPYRSIAIKCGDYCQDDKSTKRTDESKQSGVVNYTTDVRPESRLSWTVRHGMRAYVPAAKGAVHLDLRYYGDDWEVHSGTGKLSWQQRVNISSSSATGLLRWFERHDSSLLLSPFVRIYGQKGAKFYTTMIDPDMLEDPNVANAPGKVAGFPSSSVVNGALSQTTPTIYSSDPRLANYGAIGYGANVEMNVAGLTLVGGVENYRSSGAFYGQKEIPGLPKYLRFTAGMEYRF